MKKLIVVILLMLSAASVSYSQGKWTLGFTTGYSVDSRDISHTFNLLGDLGYSISEMSEFYLTTGVFAGRDWPDNHFTSFPFLVGYRQYLFTAGGVTPFLSFNAGVSYLIKNEQGLSKLIDQPERTFTINMDGFYFGSGIGAGAYIRLIDNLKLVLRSEVHLSFKARTDFVMFNAGLNFPI